MTALLKYDAACRAIAEAKSFDEVRDWEDKAAAVREYSRRIHNRQLEIDCIEIRVRAKKRRGELLLQLKELGRLKEGRKPSSGDDSLTLKDLGVTANESSEDQRIAQIDGNSFERLVARCRAYTEAHPERHSFDVLKPPPEGPITGARSIMGSRQEPDDSLDYFPTPPWATRALMERVFPVLGIAGKPEAVLCAWEPACGEGHIAEVLQEYFAEVAASDVFDYGYGRKVNFLEAEFAVNDFDWIITNPPFDEKALDFTLRALRLAEVGVAMFVRWQWIESIGRYEKLFKPFPPTIVCPFAERVPLCKGEWKPGGSTATAYCWVVWLKLSPSWGTGLPTLLHWIPPGCRESLTHSDDAERFTAHPVIRRKVDSTGNPLHHDPSTGEIIQEKTA